MKIFEKVLRLGVDPYGYSVYLEVAIEKETGKRLTVDLEEITEWETLSMSGYAQYRPQQDYNYCGQINDMIREELMKWRRVFYPVKIVMDLLDIWDKWHLNDLHAGTRAQEEAIKEAEGQTDKGLDYEQRRELLRSKGLLLDRGYEYGTAWLVEPLHPGMRETIKQLASTTFILS